MAQFQSCVVVVVIVVVFYLHADFEMLSCFGIISLWKTCVDFVRNSTVNKIKRYPDKIASTSFCAYTRASKTVCCFVLRLIQASLIHKVHIETHTSENVLLSAIFLLKCWPCAVTLCHIPDTWLCDQNGFDQMFSPEEWEELGTRLNSILMTQHYRDLFSVSDWFCYSI